MRRTLLLVVPLLVVSGCGAAGTTVPESAVVDVLHRAGFADVHRLTGPKAPSPSSFAAAENEANYDLIYAGPFRTDGKLPLAVLWAASPALAAQRSNSDPRRRSVLVHHAVVCNLVVSSYGDAARFDRVVDLLQERCG